jgi:hypothetical protein
MALIKPLVLGICVLASQATRPRSPPAHCALPQSHGLYWLSSLPTLASYGGVGRSRGPISKHKPEEASHNDYFKLVSIMAERPAIIESTPCYCLGRVKLNIFSLTFGGPLLTARSQAFSPQTPRALQLLQFYHDTANRQLLLKIAEINKTKLSLVRSIHTNYIISTLSLEAQGPLPFSRCG